MEGIREAFEKSSISVLEGDMFSLDLLVEVFEVQPWAYELIWQAVENIES